MFTDSSIVKDDGTKSSMNLRHQLSLQSQNIVKDQFENTKWSYSPLHPKPIDTSTVISYSLKPNQSVQNDEQQQNDQDDQSNENSVEQQQQKQQQSNKWLKKFITEGVMNKLLPIPIMIVVTKVSNFRL